MTVNDRIGIQGIQASNTEAAAHALYGTDADLGYYESFQGVFDAVRTGEVGRLVVAFANPNTTAAHGYIVPTFRELHERGAETWITAQTILWVRHKLLALPGATKEGIMTIHSQREAIEQCTDMLDQDYPNAVHALRRDTALSAMHVKAAGDLTQAAIATKAAADRHGLIILEEDMQNSLLNPTQFVSWMPRAAGMETITGNENQTYLWVRVPDSKVPGALEDKVLDVLKAHDISLSDIHSSYIPNSLLEKEFYLQAEAGYIDDAMQRSLKELERRGCLVTVLGSCVRPELPPVPSDLAFDN